MNSEDKEKTEKANKQLLGSIFSCVAVLLLIGTGVAASVSKNTKPPTPEQTVITTTKIQNQSVNKKLNNEKDIRTPTTAREKEKEKEKEEEEEAESKIISAAKTDNSAPERYVLPLGTQISRDYDSQKPVYNEILGDYRTHNGVDFKGAVGDSVKCCADGKVKSVYEDTIWGTVVEITHGGGIISKYCGLQPQTLKVKAGDTVKIGESIGFIGEIPCEKNDSSPHIHFETRVNSQLCDPLELLNKINDTD